MKRGNSTSFLIVALACLGAFAVYHQSASSGHHSARPADMTPSQDAGSRAENGTSQNETSPGSVISGAAAATKVDGIEPSSSPAEAPGLSLKKVERMRKLAIAHSTPASQYISEMFDAASPRADIAATVLHGDLSKGKPDPAWSTASEKTLCNEMAQLPSNFSSRLEFSRVKCGPSLCEIQAAARFTSPYQSSEDILDWQAFVQEMLRSPSSQADQLTNPVTILSMTPDDRPLFVVYFHRGQKGGSNSAGN